MDALTLQLMAWVSDRPRTYGEVMEAWTTTCPRTPIWEDAVSDGLVRVEGEGRMRERAVGLRPRAAQRAFIIVIVPRPRTPALPRAMGFRRAQARW
jgi:hypothetical protein